MMSSSRQNYDLPIDSKDIAWKTALCLDSENPDRFFVDEYLEHWRVTNDAIALCNLCPIKIDCLNYAYGNRLDGVWGGSTTQQRRAWRRKANEDARKGRVAA
jgi:hypothetical protein